MNSASGKLSPAIPDVSVVVPVYRSESTLRELCARLADVFESLSVEYEVIFVDDDSPDDSWRVLAELQSAHPDRVVAVQLMRNAGQHNALMCGFHHARGRYILTMDDDLQHPPEEIPKLFDAIEDSRYDLVYGVPEHKQHESWRNLGSLLVTIFYRVVFRSKIRLSALRIMRRELVESILSYTLNYTYIDGLLAWNTSRIGQVSVDHRPRTTGRSGYSLRKLVILALNLFTNFSLLPLQFVSAVGLLASLSGFAVAFYYLGRYLLAAIIVPGYASTIVAILVLGGLQLLALGVLGEYVGRLHLNVNRKPQYTVRQVRDKPAPAKCQPIEVDEPAEQAVPRG